VASAFVGLASAQGSLALSWGLRRQDIDRCTAVAHGTGGKFYLRIVLWSCFVA
jgi:hypothetical protein